MENLFDPSHIPFAHHGIMGAARRDKAQPLRIQVINDITTQGERMTPHPMQMAAAATRAAAGPGVG